MSLTLASSLSYDSMVIGICFLFIASIFHLAFGKKERIGRKEILYLAIMSIFLIELKQVYFPLILLYFLIPKSKFANTKSYWLNFLIISFTGIIAHVFWILISGFVLSRPEHQFFDEQLSFIMNNPFEFLVILLRTFYVNSFYYLNSFVANIGWLDTNFPYIFILLFLLILFATAVLDVHPNVKISMKQKLGIGLTFLIIIGLIETSLYLIWTSFPDIGGIGHPIISGVQGRYFIPCSILFLIMFYWAKSNENIILKKSSIVLEHALPYIVLYTCILTAFILLLRYWIS